MDVHSGYPYWLIANGLLIDYPALEQNLPNEEIIIIGSGISGALAAHALCKAGFRCTIIDKRIASAGSTWASTAHVNYELDSFLFELAGWYDEDFAVDVYKASFDAVNRLKEVAAEVGGPLELLQPKPSLYLASDKKGAKALEKEFHLRSKHNFPAELLNEEKLKTQYGIKRRAALFHTQALQADSYKLTAALLKHNIDKGNLRLYTRTEIKKLQPEKDGVSLLTTTGFTLKARYVICAPGYESAQFLPKKIMTLHSTYALVTQPIHENLLWKDSCLVWETARPYFYLRTTTDNRIMMGGGDEPFSNAVARDALLAKKKEGLLKQCREVFPQLKNIEADFYWCGTFGETGDGLPNIGKYPGMDNVYFALGYGGNGTSYSVIAADVICNQLTGKEDNHAKLFEFGRKHA